MSPQQFVEKWSQIEQSEAVSREHFIDLCHILDLPTPTDADPTGEVYAFEKHVLPLAAASKGSKGFGGYVDVWKKGHFTWEYKRKGRFKDLTDAYRQACTYRDALDNPPLTVVCDISRTIIHTHFTGYPKREVEIRLEEYPSRLTDLRRIFTDPERFRPEQPRDQLTEELAAKFGEVARTLIHGTAHEPDLFAGVDAGLGGKTAAAHFLMKVVFCLFAEDIGLLPPGLFTRAIDNAIAKPEHFPAVAGALFSTMATGGTYGEHVIEHFNGGLFAGKDDALKLNQQQLRDLKSVAIKEWHGVDPSIFGTLFERLLDPNKRAQIGAHYTSADDIKLVIDPVILQPLRRKWDALKTDLAADAIQAASEDNDKKRAVLAEPVVAGLNDFREHLGTLRILDPACGSGNFLYVALQALLDLDNEIVRWAAQHGVTLDNRPHIHPGQLHGIEINPYAVELAQVSVWIGYLQWLQARGIDMPRRPILETLNTIECRDAILRRDGATLLPIPASWPEADFIVGNPPFLGGTDIWTELGTVHRDALWSAYDLPGTSDLCCYWLEKARIAVHQRPSARAGLLATQSVRHSASREVMNRIKLSGDIFFAWSDRNWVKEKPSKDDAHVHVAIVGIASSVEGKAILNGQPVDEIFADLTGDLDLTKAKMLRANCEIAFSGTKKGGLFNLSHGQSKAMLSDTGNPHGRPNSDVIKPWLNGDPLGDRRWSGKWIIDFGFDAALDDAANYEMPFRYVQRVVLPVRKKNKRPRRRDVWWLHSEVAPGMRRAVAGLGRQLAIKRVSKHQMFRWMPANYLPDDGVYVFARNDDYFLGVLSSSTHELWSRRKGSQRREAESGFRYTATTTFETFPLPWSPGEEDTEHPAYQRIAAAAKALDAKRENWLNPPEWIAVVEQRVDAAEDFSDVPEDVRPLVRRSAVMAAAAKDGRLKKRTLTNLYNQRPEWLKLAHLELDRAVLAAYAAVDPEGDWDEGWAEVWRETGAGRPLPADAEASQGQARHDIDQAVLANLLRLNGVRATAG